MRTISAYSLPLTDGYACDRLIAQQDSLIAQQDNGEAQRRQIAFASRLKI